MTYTSKGVIYYHQQYSWAGEGQGYIAFETVSGSRFDQSFYKSRIDYYDPAKQLTSQTFLDGQGAVVMKSDYVHHDSGPWALLESDFLPTGDFREMDLAHQIYSLADGTVYIDSVHRTVDGARNVYSTGAAISAAGWSARIDQYDARRSDIIVQQQFLNSNHDVSLTIDYSIAAVVLIGKIVRYGSIFDNAPYSRITDSLLSGPSALDQVWYRVYDLRDGSHTFEVLKAQQSVTGTQLGSGITNADDTFRLFGDDLVRFEGRFGNDVVYDFHWQSTTGLNDRIEFDHLQFADLAAVRAAAAVTDNGHDITITNSFGDTVVLKEVIHDAITINDVLNANSVLFF